MPELHTILVPDIGDFKDVEVIEVHVAAGDTVALEDPLITLESDKAALDVPASAAGTIAEVLVKVGDRLSEGSPVCRLEQTADAGSDAAKDPDAGQAGASGSAAGKGRGDTAPASGRAGAAQADRADQARQSGNAPARKPDPASEPGKAPSPAAEPDEEADIVTEVVVLGAGPGGYTAAFRAADLGKQTVLVERYPRLGGVCLNVGCIPSKALLHTAEVISAAAAMAAHGVSFGEPDIDLPKLAAWKDKVVERLTEGLAGLAKQRKVQVVQGTGRFTSPHTLAVETPDGTQTIRFEHAIIAAGSQATQIPSFPNDDPRLMDSTDALLLEEIPARMLVIGGGIIGLEMATVYAALGSRITVVELLEGLMPGCDRDLVRPLQKRIEAIYENIFLGTKVTGIEATEAGLKVSFDGPKAPAEDTFDRVLVAVGRRPNGKRIDADRAGVKVDEAGFIAVDRQQRTNVAHIHAIGDIVGQPMLAHKATHEGKVAAEVIAGHKVGFDALTIPSVAYTDPEVAWMGKTEEQAKAEGIDFDKAVFPWAASGRALGNDRAEGFTKLLFDAGTRRIIGAGIVGTHAGDLIAETVLALEMGADAEDIGLTIHPHPTLSETIGFAAEMAEGTITDLYIPRKKARSKS